MVSSSPSFKRSYKPPISLNYLPDDLLVEISLCVGTSSSSLSEIHNLQLVSKSFQRFCNDRYVLHKLSLPDIDRLLWINHNRCENFSNFFKRCVKYGNPEALYHRGLTDYFHQVTTDDQQRDRGLKYLAKAAKDGNQKAQYVYGIILICLGGITKHKGFKILSSLIKPLMSDTMEEMEKLRKTIKYKISWRGGIMVMTQLKGSYVRENCRCDGRTEEFFEKFVWHQYGEGNDMITSSSACEICLWHHVVQLFLK